MIPTITSVSYQCLTSIRDLEPESYDTLINNYVEGKNHKNFLCVNPHFEYFATRNDRQPRLAFVNDCVDRIEHDFWSSPSKYLNKQVKMGSKKLFGPEINISTVAALVLYQILKKHSHIIDAMKTELFI